MYATLTSTYHLILHLAVQSILTKVIIFKKVIPLYLPNPSLPLRKLCLSPQLLSPLNIFMRSTTLAVEDSDQLACEGANSSFNAVCSSMERLCFDLQNGYLQHLFLLNKYSKLELGILKDYLLS